MKKTKLFLVKLLLLLLATYSCQVEDQNVASDTEFGAINSDFLNHQLSDSRMKPLWQSAISFDNEAAVEVNFLTDKKYYIPLSENKKVMGRQRLLLIFDEGTIQETIIDYIPSNDFSGNIKEINSDNFVTQFEGKVTLKKVGKNFKMVWYVSGGEIVKKTILVPSTSTKTVTSKPSISAETTAYYQVYFNSSGEDEIEDTWDLGWLEEVTVNNNYGGSEPDYGYNGSGLYGDMGYYDPYSYGENGGDTYDGAGGGASSSGSSSSSGGTDTDDKPTFRFDPNDNYQALYPRFTGVVRDLKNFVNNNKTVMDALIRYSGFNREQVLKHLTYGNGPLIKVEEMTGEYGKYDGTNDILKINASFVRGLETAYYQSTQNATSFLLAVTILHEYVHYGTDQNNISEGIYDFGFGFERDAFKVYVGKDNAGELYLEFKS